MSMLRIRRGVGLLGAAIIGFAAPTVGQESRAVAVVDFVSRDGIYLSVGTVHGIRVGDTIAVYESSEAADPIGRVLIVSASRRRSIAEMLSGSLAPERGDRLFVMVPPGRVTPTPAREPRAGVRTTEAVRAEAVPVRARSATRWSGRFALDVDARQNRVSWGGNQAGSATRRFATPTARLTLRGTNLSGGFSFQANLRGAQRYTDGSAITPTTSIRVYGLSLTKRLERVPLEIRLGRFSNEYESYSAYWDGIALRLGGETGLGVGVVAGLEPKRYNQSPAGDLRKVTAFADYGVRAARFRYDTDVSLHLIRPTGGSTDRTFLGWSQNLTVGRISVDQRVQVDRVESTGEWSLSRLRVRATARLGPRLRVHIGGGRSRPLRVRSVGEAFGRTRDEVRVGVSLAGQGSSFSADLGQTRWEGGDRGTAVSTSVSRTVGSWSLLGAGRYWFRGDQRTLSVSPSAGTRLGDFNVRVRYQYYRTDAIATTESHLGELSASVMIARGMRLSVQAHRQFGSVYAGTRIHAGISRSF